MRKTLITGCAVLFVVSSALVSAQEAPKGRSLEKRIAAPPPQPSITAVEFVHGSFSPPQGDPAASFSASPYPGWIRAGTGDLLEVRGTALDGLSSTVLRGTPADVPITATQSTAGGFMFRIPAGLAANSAWRVVVTKGALASNGDKLIYIAPSRTRKLYGIDKADTLVRAGGILHVHGVGLSRTPLTSLGDYVYGAYFGTGTPGAPSNQIVAHFTSGDDYNLALAVDSNCNQSGPLILAARKPDGTEELIQTTFIKVRCVK
jgi:hypothetical protein